MIWTLIGIIAAGLIAWFFLGPRKGERARGSEVQEVTVRVSGSYSPSRIVLEAGRPARIIFDRQESESCSDQVLVPAFHIQRDLPAFQKTPVEFTPDKPGEYEFTCSMGMYRGTILVESPETKIGRPRQVYVGAAERQYVPIQQR